MAEKVRKLSGKNFYKLRYFLRKSEAVKAAEAQRKRGLMARVVPEDDGYCVYTR
jgi:hypothetical protein